ncbi:UBA domain protein [Spraguea lophii 42_110]|uniref:UBA domain protein n=1 Tax=Spraguea lophii (strain 42_110) TaxID=1358809 RepID=S7W7N9_SPRLO|nr:UBA domain protein [Spraguea lophii 42_110]
MSRTLSAIEEETIKKLESTLNIERITNIKNFSVVRHGKKLNMHDPVIFKVEGLNEYIAFGDLTVQFDIEQLKKQLLKMQEQKQQEETLEEKQNEVEEIEPVEFDAEKLKEEDITLIMEQQGVTREKAIKTLVDANYDVVSAMVKIQEK